MTANPEKQKAKLLFDLTVSRQAILNLAVQTAPGLRDAAFLGEWCVKDLLAHMIGWDVTNLEAVQEILCGQRPQFFHHYDKDWRGYNKQLVSTYRREPFEVLLTDVNESHVRLTAYLGSLTADQIVNGKVKGETGRTVTIRNLLRAQAADELEHAAQLREFLTQAAQK